MLVSNLGRLCKLLHLSNSHASLTLEVSNNPIRIENDFENRLPVFVFFVGGLEQGFVRNLVPRAHVPFGQHQDTELWNNQFPETKILGLPASQRMRGLV